MKPPESFDKEKFKKYVELQKKLNELTDAIISSCDIIQANGFTINKTHDKATSQIRQAFMLLKLVIKEMEKYKQ